MQMLKNNFDIHEPSEGHFSRFKEKFEVENLPENTSKVVNMRWLLVAASLALLVSLWYNFKPDTNGYELADVSPEMEETQTFFTQVIHREVKLINLQKDEDTTLIIDDALEQVQFLEIEYQKLTIELKNSGFDKRIVNAMIFNFQQRIEILQGLLNQIDNFKKTKNETILQILV